MNHQVPRILSPAAGLAAFLFFFPGLGVMGAASQESMKTGEIIENVVCRDSPDQSYALYLPSLFVPAVKRPVLFLFDPTAKGPAAVAVFRPAAEKLGWIIAASNNSQNGPRDPNVKAAQAMFRDLSARISLDEHRIYAGGFSGGSRVASIFALAVGRRIAGVIGIAAGISPGLKIQDMGISSYFGIAGLADFNYPEMKQLDAALDGAELSHRIFFYDGRHQWPDAATCLRALGWMEVMAIKQGARDKDEALLDEIIGRELAEASALAAAERPFWAARQYEAVSRLFEGLRDINGPAAEAQKLKQSAAYADYLNKEQRRDEKETSLQQDFARAIALIEESPEDRTGLLEILRDLGLGSLKKEAKEAGAVEDRSLALRILVLISGETPRLGYACYSKGDYLRASSYYELAAESSLDGDPRLKIIHRNLASIFSLRGEARTALKHLEKAVENGFSDIRDLETDEDLEPVRSTAGFRKLIERLKSRRF